MSQRRKELLMPRSSQFQRLEKLGEGSYATVYKCQNLIDGSFVASKEIKLHTEEGVPFTAIREASLLKGLRHANIVLLHEIVHEKNALTFVFEFMDARKQEVLKLLKRRRRFNKVTSANIWSHITKEYIPTMLSSFYINYYGDWHFVMNGKYCTDFGLARAKSVPSRTYSHEVVTLWYRPPDVLLGSTDYSTSLDIWGVGCIFAELMTGSALFPGTKDVYDQLDKIFKVLGTPSEKVWPGYGGFPNYIPGYYPPYPKQPLSHLSPKVLLTRYSESLLSSLLQLNPVDRISARGAMAHPFFSDLPPQIHILPDISSVFVLPDVKLVPEVKPRYM